MVALAHQRIQLPVPQPRATLNNRGTVYDGDAVGEVASTTVGPIAFAALPLTP
ncbi:MAG: hypothetical protein NPIRA03_29450 [Nitrospirales bacterium]|nr:MAG: hypothetical protein NPIRA03_29450 [Nitrospirales bacterium]